MSRKNLIVILGPTASGKSETAIHLAATFSGEVINADAFQVYSGLDIGTGKIPEDQRAGIPHHLLDLVPPDKQFTAGDFITLTEQVVTDIRSRGKIPIIVGGTGFYIRSYLKGLAPMPRTSHSLRKVLTQMGERLGWEVLHRYLLVLDPTSHIAINPSDRQRVERALEVIFTSGRPFSHFHRGETTRPDRVHAIKIGLMLPRETLRKRIEERVHAMVREGWVEEVKRLTEEGFHPQDPGMKAIGYGELSAVLEGSMTLDEGITAIIAKTRRYAKRQMTYIKREEGVTWFDTADLELARKAIIEYSRRALGVQPRLRP